MRAGLHGGHGGLFRDIARDDDKRQVQPAGFDLGQRGEGVEAGQPVVGDDEVPRLLFQRGVQGFSRFHPAAGGRVAGPLQFVLEQGGIVGRIFDEQYAKRLAHSSRGRCAGRVK